MIVLLQMTSKEDSAFTDHPDLLGSCGCRVETANVEKGFIRGAWAT